MHAETHPNIRNGHSFKGAGQYFLHDKTPERADGKKPRDYLTTSERVAWTKTLNCVNDDPELALTEMIATARSQQQLKAAAGLAPGGRSTGLSVKTVSLSWHPDEEPTREEMEAAALSYLQKMGWHEHQTLLVAHNDTPHDHLHMIINRVHPETGRTLNDWQDQRRSQQWALEYEREHGRVWCDTRVGKYPGGRPIDPRELAHDLAVNMRDATRPGLEGEAGRDAQPENWKELIERQRAERIGFFQEGKEEFRALRQEVFREVRDEFKPLWQEHFAWSKDLQNEAKEWSANEVARALYFAKQGELEKGLDALSDREAVLSAVRDEIAEAKAELSGEQNRITRDLQDQAVDSLRERREAEYKEFLFEQLQERRQFKLHEQSDGRASWNARWAHYPENNLANDNVNEDQQIDLANPAPAAQHGADEAYVEWNPPAADVHETLSVTGAADLGAGAIGSLAGYIADEMAELFAPTPPEIREARAKAADREDAVRAEAAERAQFNAYARAAEAAIRRAEEEKETERNRAYWEARERDR